MSIKRKVTTTTIKKEEEYTDGDSTSDIPTAFNEEASERPVARENETGSDLTAEPSTNNGQPKTIDNAVVGRTPSDLLSRVKDLESILVIFIYLISFAIAPKSYGIKNYVYLSLIIGTCIVIILYVFRGLKFSINWLNRGKKNK